MRFVLAALMAVLLAVVTTTDRVACIDGCTAKAQHEGPSTTATSACGLCHGWAGPKPVSVDGPLAVATIRPARIAAHELPAHSSPLEQPPRLT